MKNLKIVSVGGGGMNAVNHMIDSGLNGAEFIACSRDEFFLQMSKADKKIHLGKNMMQYGLDGSTPSRSEQAAIESREEILETLHGADAVIIVACLGGSDGTGATPIIAKYAREVGALVVAVVTLPYLFEGPLRTTRAETALTNLSANVDSVIKIRNDNVLQFCDPKAPITHAFKFIDEIIFHTVRTLISVFQAPFKVDKGVA